ncbi:MAG: AAA family ATPase [Candidatus Auribacterota bacterium]|nr:AAA family ATPase [Candidatus Auribacterota bacterium]
MIIAIVNQKGGCGKTTTAVNLSACLADRSVRTLLIDLDPQSNATLGLGVEAEEGRNIHRVLQDDQFDIRDAIYRTGVYNLDIIPATIILSGADLDLANMMGRENLLKNKIAPVEESYDYILIDCAPSLSLLTINALSAADEVLIPIQAHYYALEGLKLLFQTVNIVKSRLNYRLAILGILPTFYDGRTAISRDVLSGLRDYFGSRILNTIIRVNSKLAEAPSANEPIHTYAPGSRGAKDYGKLADEIMKNTLKQKNVENKER